MVHELELAIKIAKSDLMADSVWEAWDVGLIPNELATVAWFLMSENKTALDVKAIEPT